MEPHEPRVVYHHLEELTPRGDPTLHSLVGDAFAVDQGLVEAKQDLPESAQLRDDAVHEWSMYRPARKGTRVVRRARFGVSFRHRLR